MRYLFLLAVIGCTDMSSSPPLPINAKIGMLGDSITRGYDGSSTPTSTSYNGYRKTLDEDCIAAGYTHLQWIGTQFMSTASYVPTRHHDGYNGASIDNFYFGSGGYPIYTDLFGIGKPLHGIDILLVNLGTNGGIPTFPEYIPLIEGIHALEPQIRFVVNTISAGNYTQFNANATQIPLGYWDTFRQEGMSVYQADAGRPPLVTGDFLFDNTHFTPAAQVTVGHLISPALIAALIGLYNVGLSWKRLVGPYPLTTVSEIMYSVPVGGKALAQYIQVINTTNHNIGFTMSIDDDAPGTRIYDNYNIEGGKTLSVPCKYVLNGSESLYSNASSAGLTLSVNGQEWSAN